MITLKMDPEFQAVLPSKEDDYIKLEKTVLADGRFTDPFITWNGFIIDGHTRYRIMQNHPEVDLQPYEKKMDDVLPDRYAAIVWIATHQKSRRNLNDFEWNDIFKKAYDAQKKSVGASTGHIFYGNQHNKSLSAEIGSLAQTKNGNHTTAESLAKEFGVSVGRLRHGVTASNALEEAERLVPGIKDAIITEKIKPTQKAIEEVLVVKDENERREYVQSMANGEKPISPRKSKQPRPMSPEMKDFTKKMLDVVADMENDDKGYGISDAVRDMEGAADIFFNQIHFVLDERKEVICETEDSRVRICEFLDGVINRLIEMKGEI